MKKQVSAIIASGFAVLAMFQNCGPNPIAFNSNEIGLTKVSLSEISSVVANNDQPSSSSGDASDNSDSSDQSNLSAPPDINEVEEVQNDSVESEKSDDSEVAKNEFDDDDDDDDGRGEQSKSDRSFICILDGPGKSVAVGFNNGSLEGQHSTPQVVCMSESACTNLVSQRFSVKGPERRGFCPEHNPHVVPMSDDEISELVK